MEGVSLFRKKPPEIVPVWSVLRGVFCCLPPLPKTKKLKKRTHLKLVKTYNLYIQQCNTGYKAAYVDRKLVSATQEKGRRRERELGTCSKKAAAKVKQFWFSNLDG